MEYMALSYIIHKMVCSIIKQFIYAMEKCMYLTFTQKMYVLELGDIKIGLSVLVTNGICDWILENRQNCHTGPILNGYTCTLHIHSATSRLG